MVETVSSDEFPNYPVRAMIIEAHEARKLNASTFISYRNLHGLHLVRPKFFFDNRSFDGFQYLTSLETIELDAETLKGTSIAGKPWTIFSSFCRSHISTCFAHSIFHPWPKHSSPN
jgi:hypothetical protein